MAHLLLFILSLSIVIYSTFAVTLDGSLCLAKEQPELTLNEIAVRCPFAILLTRISWIRHPFMSSWDLVDVDRACAKQGQQALFGNLVAYHITSVTVQKPPKKQSSPRQREEKVRLRSRLERQRGRWNSHHPRYRLLDAIYGFSRYQEQNGVELRRWKTLYKHVSIPQKAMLEHVVYYSKKLEATEQLIRKNQNLCDMIVQNALRFYEVKQIELDQFIKDADTNKRKADRTSVSQALKHFVRDWASDGEHERKATFPCILRTLGTLFPQRAAEPGKHQRVLIPGAGLGRLGYDIAALGGFDVTINEWSMYMNVAYRVLETEEDLSPFTFHPFIDSWSHHATSADMQRAVSFPDRPLNTSSVVLVEGDFTTEFQTGHSDYDAIVTHFFIDTARNLMSYLETIHRTLRPGGYWINSGPLLYGSGPFVQLSLDEIILLSEALGFEFIETSPRCGEVTLSGKKVRSMSAIYGSNERALNINGYKVQFWVARKRLRNGDR